MIDHPWHIDGRGRTATTDADDHIRDLIEAVLFTSPGERVMRPDFGAGLLRLVFEPGGLAVAATAPFLVRGALEQTLADVITVTDVTVEAPDSTVVVTVSYVVLRDGTTSVAVLRAPGGVS